MRTFTHRRPHMSTSIAGYRWTSRHFAILSAVYTCAVAAIVRLPAVRASEAPIVASVLVTTGPMVAGAAAVRVTTGPSGCTLPGPIAVVILPGAQTDANPSVPCSPITIAPSSLRLTYICGRTFRIRNPNDAVVTVTWDVFGTPESGSLTLPARPLSANVSETFFETIAIGTVRLSYNGSQSDVKANGGSVCRP